MGGVLEVKHAVLVPGVAQAGGQVGGVPEGRIGVDKGGGSVGQMRYRVDMGKGVHRDRGFLGIGRITGKTRYVKRSRTADGKKTKDISANSDVASFRPGSGSGTE